MIRAVGDTQANTLLDNLLQLSDRGIREVLMAAREYGDHPSIANAVGWSAGKRFMEQVKFGMAEVKE